MDFTELLRKRRSIRNYLEKPVSTDILKEIISESLMAPSAGNEQPWKFIIVNNKQLLKKISADCKNNLLNRIKNTPGDYAEKYLKMLQNPSFNIFYNAPALVIILGENNVKNLESDCALAACYFMMSAASRGLGTCWINFAKSLRDAELIAELGFPENHIMAAPLIIGYPAMEPAVPKRKDADILKVVE